MCVYSRLSVSPERLWSTILGMAGPRKGNDDRGYSLVASEGTGTPTTVAARMRNAMIFIFGLGGGYKVLRCASGRKNQIVLKKSFVRTDQRDTMNL
jgi:hypothetical protein